MTLDSSAEVADDLTAKWSTWINRSLEALWLLTIVLVPLAYLDRDFIRSEAVISYVEVPKLALLRLFAAIMAARIRHS